ncbi:hypothetical protein BH09PSE6_BH09PSE6_16290 [soil metagenome]
MIVCVCHRVSDRQIAACMSQGACSVRDLNRELGLGGTCGKCVPQAREVIAESCAPSALYGSGVMGNAMSQAA